MVYIQIEKLDPLLILHCHKGSEDGDYFKLTVNSKNLKVVERPKHPDIDASVAYSRICSILESGQPIPDKTVAAWG